MKWMLFPLILLQLAGCKDADKEEEAKNDTEFFPVPSFLQGQAAHIDTSVYSIVQIKKSGNSVDTSYLKREDFRKAAAEFLNLPDISSKKLRKKYEVTRLFDETIEKVILSYATKDVEMEITREDIIILPTVAADHVVESIYIERVQETPTGNVQKKMFWEANKRFQITSIIQNENQPEKIETVQVSWSDRRQ